jgi:hypothetical protein
MKKEDPLGGEKENHQLMLQKIIQELGQFYDNLVVVLKDGSPWQKKLALDSFKRLQDGMKQRLESFCEKEGLDVRLFEKFMTSPEMQESTHIQELKGKIADIDNKLTSMVKSKKNSQSVGSSSKKAIKSLRKKRKMENRLRSNL